MAANRTGVYVDDFLAEFSTFPLELQRLLSLIRELDARSHALQAEIKDEVLELLRSSQPAVLDALTPGVGSSSTTVVNPGHQPNGDPGDQSHVPKSGSLKRKAEDEAEDTQAESRVRPRLLSFQSGTARGEQPDRPAKDSRDGDGQDTETKEQASRGEGGERDRRDRKDRVAQQGREGAEAGTSDAGGTGAGSRPEWLPETMAINQDKAAALCTEKVTLSRQACDLLESHVRRLTQELKMFEEDLQQDGKVVGQEDPQNGWGDAGEVALDGGGDTKSTR